MTKVSNIKSNTSNDRTAEFSTTDELGRTYILKRPSYLKGLQLTKMLGELADNKAYCQGVYYFTWIKSIDGVELPPIGSVLELEALAQRLDHEGVIAIQEAIFERAEVTGKSKEEIEQIAEKNKKEVVSAAKK